MKRLTSNTSYFPLVANDVVHEFFNVIKLLPTVNPNSARNGKLLHTTYKMRENVDAKLSTDTSKCI